MSDVSELYFLDCDTRPTWCELESNSSPYLLAVSHLPIVWLALFQEQDVRIDINCLKDRNRAYFAAKRGTAIANFEKRISWIRSAVPSLDEVWLLSFMRLLVSCKRLWVHVQPLTIERDGSVPSVDVLKQLLAIFDAPPIPLGVDIQGSAEESNLYRAHFSSRFNSAACQITFACLGASGTETLMAWECLS